MLLPMVFLAAILGSWAGERTPPARLLSAEVLTPAVAPGGVVQIRYVVQRDRSCETKIDRLMFDVDGRRHPLPDIDSVGPLGPNTYIATGDVPSYFAPGVAKIVTASSYICNPLHRLFPIIAGPRDTEFIVAP